jgi:membrane associated rhomboid family serine protease
MSIVEEIKDSIRNGSVLTRLIYINLGVFLFIHIVAIFFFLFNNGSFPMGIIQFLSVPADLSALAAKPWTIISYMFLHKDFFHILFNLLWLYWFGKIFLEYIDQRRLLNVYLLGGLSGAAFFIIAYNIFPALKVNASGSIALGASASVMAIVIAIAVYAPRHTIYLLFFGPVKIIYVALISFILSSIIDISVNTGGKIAHIGGALFGYYFAVQYKGGKDISRWFSKFNDYIFSIFRVVPRRKKMKVSYKKPVDDLEYNARKLANQKEIDAILDKISSKGYDSLSKEEKETLFKSGQ